MALIRAAVAAGVPLRGGLAAGSRRSTAAAGPRSRIVHADPHRLDHRMRRDVPDGRMTRRPMPASR